MRYGQKISKSQRGFAHWLTDASCPSAPIFLEEKEENALRLVLAFWTLDIMLSFNTGVYRHGMEVLDRSYVIRVYARTWTASPVGPWYLPIEFTKTGGVPPPLRKDRTSDGGLRLSVFLKVLSLS